MDGHVIQRIWMALWFCFCFLKKAQSSSSSLSLTGKKCWKENKLEIYCFRFCVCDVMSFFSGFPALIEFFSCLMSSVDGLFFLLSYCSFDDDDMILNSVWFFSFLFLIVLETKQHNSTHFENKMMTAKINDHLVVVVCLFFSKYRISDEQSLFNKPKNKTKSVLKKIYCPERMFHSFIHSFCCSSTTKTKNKKKIISIWPHIEFFHF